MMKPEEAEIEALLTRFTNSLRLEQPLDDEDFRRSLEANLRRQLSSIVAQAHRFVAELKSDLCPAGEKCVLLADSMEKVVGYGDDAQKVYDSVLRLFVSEGAALRLPGVHLAARRCRAGLCARPGHVAWMARLERSHEAELSTTLAAAPSRLVRKKTPRSWPRWRGCWNLRAVR